MYQVLNWKSVLLLEWVQRVLASVLKQVKLLKSLIENGFMIICTIILPSICSWIQVKDSHVFSIDELHSITGVTLGWCKGSNCAIDFCVIILISKVWSSFSYLLTWDEKKFLQHQFETLKLPVKKMGFLCVRFSSCEQYTELNYSWSFEQWFHYWWWKHRISHCNFWFEIIAFF